AEKCCWLRWHRSCLRLSRCRARFRWRDNKRGCTSVGRQRPTSMLQLVTVPGRIRLKLATGSGAKVGYPFVAGSGIGVAAVAETMVASGGAGPRRVETAERQRENGRHPGVSKGRRPTGNTPSPVGRDTAIQSTRERSALRVTYG